VVARTELTANGRKASGIFSAPRILNSTLAAPSLMTGVGVNGRSHAVTYERESLPPMHRGERMTLWRCLIYVRWCWCERVLLAVTDAMHGERVVIRSNRSRPEPNLR
jgi:hypothetical protein